MRVQNPFAGVGTTGLDSQVLMALARAGDYLIVDEIHRLLPEGDRPRVSATHWTGSWPRAR